MYRIRKREINQTHLEERFEGKKWKCAKSIIALNRNGENLEFPGEVH